VGTGSTRGTRPRRPGQSAAARPLGQFHRATQAARDSHIAIARELAGWCWSLAVMDEQTTHKLASSTNLGGGSA